MQSSKELFCKIIVFMPSETIVDQTLFVMGLNIFNLVLHKSAKVQQMLFICVT